MPSDDQVEALATSVDGRHFVYDVATDDLDVRVGGYVVIGEGRLGYVTSVAIASRDGQRGLASRLVRVEGRLLEGPDRPFGATPTRVATPAEVSHWLDAARPARAVPGVGSLTFADGVPLALDAGAFDRHTFLCGQSGSGKTYALGTILERLLAETSLRIVILDPNSDFVRLAELREEVGVDDARADTRPPPEASRSAGPGTRARTGCTFASGTSTRPSRRRVLRLDPIADREEYAALAEAVEHSGATGAGNVARWSTAVGRARPTAFARGSRTQPRRRPLADLVGERPGSLEELVQPGGPRCVVADLGSLADARGAEVAAEAVLAALWRRRAAREPVLIVIDEAHNVCPAEPEDR